MHRSHCDAITRLLGPVEDEGRESRSSRRDKGKAILIEDVPLRQRDVLVGSTWIEKPRDRAAEVLPLLQYLDRKREKYVEGSSNETYVEIVRNRTQIKVELAAEVAAKERSSQPTEAKYQALQRKLFEEVEKRRKADKSVTVFAAAEEKKQEYQFELAVRTKKPTEYEAAQIANLELIKRLEAQCGKLRTQWPQAEEQLCEVEVKFTEAEGKNRQ
ncbi:hypothetical protein AXG93_2891s1120 [Marchantia polymorpha subsp. ruderalis]|uniref:Uncharacterized protein n=1 Tax=Marchantia polymorpha subsp. ruderalis TaxID=1480154 RepID=A0A176WLQ1_MARPO|nr:hypothetical protein AXG93_2891s1120 [Marchantia polymorpha subsp. ruderalis]